MKNPAAKSPSQATIIEPAMQPKTIQAIKAIKHPDGSESFDTVVLFSVFCCDDAIGCDTVGLEEVDGFMVLFSVHIPICSHSLFKMARF